MLVFFVDGDWFFRMRLKERVSQKPNSLGQSEAQRLEIFENSTKIVSLFSKQLFLLFLWDKKFIR